MDAEVEKLQWLICSRCGVNEVPGKRVQKMYDRLLSDGKTPEEAQERVSKEGSWLYDCPTEHLHEQQKPLVPFAELEDGAYYLGSCRNAALARWNAAKRHFVYMRQKFDYVYAEAIGYWIEAKPGEHRFDEFKPYCKMENPPFEIPVEVR